MRKATFILMTLLIGIAGIPLTPTRVHAFASNMPSVRLDRLEQTGYATFVTHRRDGGESASGEIFRGHKMVAAHRTLPFGSVVQVTNLENRRSVTVRVIDRGPYGKNFRKGTIIDLSRAAATRLRMLEDGLVPVRVVILRLGGGRPLKAQREKEAETSVGQ
jgi:rare lipoprotein A